MCVCVYVCGMCVVNNTHINQSRSRNQFSVIRRPIRSTDQIGEKNKDERRKVVEEEGRGLRREARAFCDDNWGL